MSKLKFKLSGFDIGMIITFVVVGLMGGGAWYYLSGMLQDAQTQDTQIRDAYAQNSAKGGLIVSPANADALQANADLLQKQADPVISSFLLAKDNGISAIGKEDPVAWKHDLDEDVKVLTTDAKSRSIVLPNNFYFGFSRYLTESPNDEATAVLSKQRAAVKAISEILINAKVSGIQKVRRTYEEDPHAATAMPSAQDRAEGDQLGGYAVAGPGGLYTAYPFEIDFDTTAESFRPVLSELIKSPYLFVVRSVEVHNDRLDSPTEDTLAKMAQVTPGAPSVVDSAPGAVADTPIAGPQYLFGNSVLHVKLRVDMIEWNPLQKSVATTLPAASSTHSPAHP